MRSLLLLALITSVSFAGPEPLPYAKTAKEAVHIARTRGKLIFITACIDGDSENRAAVKNVLHSKKWQKVARDFVLIYANKDRDHGSVMVKTGKGKREKRDADVPELTNEQVQMFANTYVAAFLPDEAEGHVKTPIHFIVDSDEEVVATIFNGDWKMGFNHVPADTVIKHMQAALKKHGKGISERQYVAMQKDIVDARAAKARDNTGLEIKHLLRVAAMPKKLEDVKNVQARLDKIDGTAKKELVEIEDLIRLFLWEDALGRLEKIQKSYAGLPSALRAATRAKELLKNKDVKRVLKARDIYNAGMRYKKDGRTEKAEKKFAECVRKCKGTKYAQLAEKELQEAGG
jgi:hypothetical protein